MSIELNDQQIADLLRGVKIPPQPQIMVDLQFEQQSENCSIGRVCELISQDVGLSGTLLKTINSPFFGLPNKLPRSNKPVIYWALKA